MGNCKNEVLLSFIIPVYNVEKYLSECVDSILQQITDEFEVILVNDGSTDSSGDICEQFAELDTRIHIVHKENGGLSSARNTGCLIAKGQYVTFVDSDDKIYSDSIVDILHWIKKGGTDMCFLHAEKFYPDGTRTDLGENIACDKLRMRPREEAISYLASRPKYPGSAWAKLFRREFLIKNNLHFPYDRRYSEDLGFIRDCILYARDFDVLDVPYYQYRQNRQGSITSKITSKNFYDLLLFVTESCDKLTVNKKAKDSISKSVMGFVAYEYSVLLYLYNSIPQEKKEAGLFKLKEYKWVLKFASNTKVKIIAFVCRLFGVKFTSFLIKHYRKRTEK